MRKFKVEVEVLVYNLKEADDRCLAEKINHDVDMGLDYLDEPPCLCDLNNEDRNWDRDDELDKLWVMEDLDSCDEPIERGFVYSVVSVKEVRDPV